MSQSRSKPAAAGRDLLRTLPWSAAGAASGADDRPKGLQTIGEIVVTAQRRAESNLAVGMTLSALSARCDRGAPHRAGHGSAAAACPTSTSRSRCRVRCRSSRSAASASTTSARRTARAPASTSTRCTSRRSRMMAFDMYDLERIEVLKGPQGTLYGRNSTAGAINIITASRSSDFDAYASSGYGDYDTLDVGGAVNMPLGDNRACDSAARPCSKAKAIGRAASCRARRSASATSRSAGCSSRSQPSEAFDVESQGRSACARAPRWASRSSSARLTR